MQTKSKLGEELTTLFTTGKPHFPHHSGLTLSAGVNYLQLKTGDWLVNAIARYQQAYDMIYDSDLKAYQLWELSTATDTRAVLRCYRDHKDLQPVIEESINPRGFPLAKLRLYIVDGVLMLSSELFDKR